MVTVMREAPASPDNASPKGSSTPKSNKRRSLFGMGNKRRASESDDGSSGGTGGAPRSSMTSPPPLPTAVIGHPFNLVHAAGQSTVLPAASAAPIGQVELDLRNQRAAAAAAAEAYARSRGASRGTAGEVTGGSRQSAAPPVPQQRGFVGQSTTGGPWSVVPASVASGQSGQGGSPSEEEVSFTLQDQPSGMPSSDDAPQAWPTGRSSIDVGQPSLPMAHVPRPRQDSAPPTHSRHRSHFSIPDVVVTAAEEDGETMHFEVKVPASKRRSYAITPLSGIYTAGEGVIGASAVQPAVISPDGKNKSSKAFKIRPLVRLDSDEVPQNRPIGTNGTGNENGDASPTSPASQDSAPFSSASSPPPARSTTPGGKRSKKSAFPLLFGKKDRSATMPLPDAGGSVYSAATSGGLGSSTGSLPTNQPSSSNDSLANGASVYVVDHGSSSPPASPTRTSSMGFQARSTPPPRNSGSPGPASAQSAPQPAALSAAAKKQARKEAKAREKEELALMKELEKVDRMVRLHDAKEQKAASKKKDKAAKRQMSGDSAGSSREGEIQAPERRSESPGFGVPLQNYSLEDRSGTPLPAIHEQQGSVAATTDKKKKKGLRRLTIFSAASKAGPSATGSGLVRRTSSTRRTEPRVNVRSPSPDFRSNVRSPSPVAVQAPIWAPPPPMPSLQQAPPVQQRARQPQPQQQQQQQRSPPQTPPQHPQSMHGWVMPRMQTQQSQPQSHAQPQPQFHAQPQPQSHAQPEAHVHAQPRSAPSPSLPSSPPTIVVTGASSDVDVPTSSSVEQVLAAQEAVQVAPPRPMTPPRVQTATQRDDWDFDWQDIQSPTTSSPNAANETGGSGAGAEGVSRSSSLASQTAGLVRRTSVQRALALADADEGMRRRTSLRRKGSRGSRPGTGTGSGTVSRSDSGGSFGAARRGPPRISAVVEGLAHSAGGATPPRRRKIGGRFAREDSEDWEDSEEPAGPVVEEDEEETHATGADPAPIWDSRSDTQDGQATPRPGDVALAETVTPQEDSFTPAAPPSRAPVLASSPPLLPLTISFSRPFNMTGVTSGTSSATASTTSTVSSVSSVASSGANSYAGSTTSAATTAASFGEGSAHVPVPRTTASGRPEREPSARVAIGTSPPSLARTYRGAVDGPAGSSFAPLPRRTGSTEKVESAPAAGRAFHQALGSGPSDQQVVTGLPATMAFGVAGEGSEQEEEAEEDDEEEEEDDSMAHHASMAGANTSIFTTEPATFVFPLPGPRRPSIPSSPTSPTARERFA